MRIASKINAALIGAFACASLATFAVLETTIQPRFDDIEKAQAKMNHDRVIGAFDTFTEKLATAAQDYSYWDETYRFLQGEDVSEFIISNLTPEFKAVANLEINALIFMRSDGAVQWGAAYDIETEEPFAGLVEDLANLARTKYVADTTSVDAIRGMVNTGSGLVLVAIAPALKSDHSGPAVGKVIAAARLSEAAAKELTGVDFQLELVKDQDATSAPSGDVVMTSAEDQIHTASVLNDVFGNPLVRLTAHSPRDVSQTGAMAIRSAFLLMLLAGLTSAAVLWAFLRREVVSRVEALKSHFTTAGRSGKIQQTAVGTRNDELCELAQSFNTMADQVNHLRDALADSSYKSGLSEWAAGTLHNVRNGLAPVTAATWQVEQLFDGAWLKNVSTAAAELGDADTPEERRKKLNTFLVGSATRFADAARQTSELTAKITAASRSVLDMVAEFERYAHRKVEMEDVDLLPLIREQAAAIALTTSDIELVLPSETALVKGNGVILGQIITNLLINAKEAIAGHVGKGRIEVAISEPHGMRGLARITISDNGEGIAADNLTKIFHRGVSSRRERTGGLGLHWCANAIRVFGGSIRASSPGRGHGATITIDLPSTTTSIEEAA